MKIFTLEQKQGTDEPNRFEPKSLEPLLNV